MGNSNYKQTPEFESLKFVDFIPSISSEKRMPMQYFQRIMALQQEEMVLLARKRDYSFQQLSRNKTEENEPQDFMKVRHVLNKVLKKQKTLKDLKLPPGIGYLKGQSHLRCLKNLQFSPMRTQKLGDVVRQEKRTFKRVTQLSLTPEDYFRADAENIEMIEFLLHPYLQTLHLKLTFPWFTKREYTSLSSQMAIKLRYLKHLKLDLLEQEPHRFDPNYQEIEHEKIRILCSEFGDNLKSLETLSLTLPTNNAGVIILCEWIGTNMKALQGLHLDFSRCYNYIQDSGANCLSVQIPNNLKKLKSLILKFSYGSGLNCEPIKNMGEEIGRNLQTLEEFRIRLLLPKKNAEEAIVNFGKHISENLKSLKTLELQLFCLGPTKNGVKILCEFIGNNLQQLESFTLIMSVFRITDATFRSMGRDLGKLSKLKHISLSFDNCEEITDGNFSEFLRSFIGDKIRPLRSIDFSFSNCYKISDVSLRTLAFQIENYLPFLQSLKLYLEAHLLTKEETRSFRTRIQNKLKHLKYFFIRTYVLSIIIN